MTEELIGARGLEGVLELHQAYLRDPKSIPTVAIGGIDLGNVSDVMNCGVTCVAVVRALTLSESLEDDLEKFQSFSPIERQKQSSKIGDYDVIR